MDLKPLGKEIIFLIKHPIHLIIMIWLSFELLEKLRQEMYEERALERMIYKK